MKQVPPGRRRSQDPSCNHGVALIDSYDEIRYPNIPRNQSHPAYISALASIAGLTLDPVERWRVLEVGCGDGCNILPLAFDYPEGHFVGVDRARETIDSGRKLAVAGRLPNIEFHTADLLEWKPPGEFDYIIAHGVFSWVPPEVREKILQICGDCLSAKGVAFVSYNAFPGSHFRRFAWDVLKFHTRRHTDSAARIESAREMALLISNHPGEEPFGSAIRKEMETILRRDKTALFHDDLADPNVPFYLLDFVAQAERHGLQYLADADPERDNVGGLPFQVDDWLEARQYGDFFARRRFRETILCRREIPLDRRLSLDRFRNLFVASRAKPAQQQEDGKQRFDLFPSGNLTTNHPLGKELLRTLSSLWPRSMQLSEFPLDSYRADTTADLLMSLIRSGALELRTSPPRMSESISQRPMASALARLQIAEGYQRVTSQRHQALEMSDEIGRRLLCLLDGNHDRQSIARSLREFGIDAGAIDSGLEESLQEFYRLCLLVE
jgi:SAM-dependent methyltransferase